MGQSGELPARSVGRALPGIEVRMGEHGEILVRGPTIMRGYFNDPEATAAAIRDGWLHTGDCGHLEEEGFLFVAGRLKEAIVTAAGRTMYPEDVEAHYRHRLFAELCVAPLRGANGNDVPALFVVPTSGEASDAELHETFARLRAAAPPGCLVERLVRLGRPLPRTASGKVQRRLLAEQFGGEA